MKSRNGMQVIVPAETGEWGRDRPNIEHFPLTEFDEELNPEMNDRDLIAAVRNSHGEALLDGAVWTALRGAGLDFDTVDERRPMVPVHPRANHRVIEATRLSMELRDTREAMEDELRRCQKVLKDTRAALRRHA